MLLLLHLNILCLTFCRRCCWNSMSIQMRVWQISHASLLYSSGGVNIYFWGTLAIWSFSFRPPYLVSSCFKCCSYEICWHWWVTWASTNSARVPNWSFLSLPRITKWGTSYLFCISHILNAMHLLNSDKNLIITQVIETNRAEESHGHVHRMYFMGPNTFSEPWHLPHSPPEQITEIVYVCLFTSEPR